MRNTLPISVLWIVALFSAGCQSNSRQTPPAPVNGPAATTSQTGRPIAYLDGRVVTQDEVYALLAQSHGGEALTEILLDRAVANRLKQEQIQLSARDVEAEADRLLASLSSEADEAARLLQAMRERQGLDSKRYQAMLRRNAGLRKLVRDEVTINEAAILQAYRFRYGPRYEVRLIVTNALSKLTPIRRAVLGGASFTDQAIKYSTDSSAAQGGLLSPISPADPTYPKAIRDALPKLKLDSPQARLSPAIALDSGYALLWLEDIITKDGPPLEDVRAELESAVRYELEQLRMRQLARTLIEQADVMVLDPALEKGWKKQKGTIE